MAGFPGLHSGPEEATASKIHKEFYLDFIRGLYRGGVYEGGQTVRDEAREW
jgi:hypothetical protein